MKLNIKLVSLTILILLGTGFNSLFAAGTKLATRQGKDTTIIVAADERVNDIIAVNSKVEIKGTVMGLMFCVDSNVTLYPNSEVKDDINIINGKLIIKDGAILPDSPDSLTPRVLATKARVFIDGKEIKLEKDETNKAIYYEDTQIKIDNADTNDKPIIDLMKKYLVFYRVIPSKKLSMDDVDLLSDEKMFEVKKPKKKDLKTDEENEESVAQSTKSKPSGNGIKPSDITITKDSSFTSLLFEGIGKIKLELKKLKARMRKIYIINKVGKINFYAIKFNNQETAKYFWEKILKGTINKLNIKESVINSFDDSYGYIGGHWFFSYTKKKGDTKKKYEYAIWYKYNWMFLIEADAVKINKKKNVYLRDIAVENVVREINDENWK